MLDKLIHFDLHFIVPLILAFLIGSIPTGYLLNKYSGHGDIRKVGSGNVGATNVLRHSGKLLGLLTLFIDIAKGFFASAFIPAIFSISTYSTILIFDAIYVPSVIILTGSAAVLGHIFSPWLKFKGGKGVATMLGVIFVMSLICEDGKDYCMSATYHSFIGTNLFYFYSDIFFITIFCWGMITFITKYVALASVISLVVATVYSYFFLETFFIFFILMTLLITYKHKDNFERIKNKTEHKISF